MTRFLSILSILFAATLLFSVAAKASEFTDAQKAEIKTLFDGYIMENGQAILDSVNKHQSAQIEEQEKTQNEKAKGFIEDIKKATNLAVAGNPDGDITVVEFFDYNCGYCHKALEEVLKLIEADKKVKIVFIDMPILGPQSLEAAKWSIAASKQGKYFDYHRAVMGHTGPKDPENLEKIAKDIGLDIAKLKTDKDSPDTDAIIQSNLKKGAELGIQGTPGFIIETEVARGFVTAEQMQNMIAKIRGK